MSDATNSPPDVKTLLNLLKKAFEEKFEDVSSAKDVKEIIDHLLNQFPQSQQWEQKLSSLTSLLNRFNEVKSFEFRSIRNELADIKESLALLAAEADQNDFEALSEMERDIIDKEEHPLVKSLQVSYEFFHRQLKHDPRICLFLAIFPKHAILRKRFLIYWWIGEGLVPSEEEGERVFEELLDLHLLLPHRTDKCPRVSKCKIFPWIRYMLISVANKRKLLNLETSKEEDTTSKIHIPPQFNPSYSRRACLIDSKTKIDGKTKLATQIESMETSMRTIFNVNKRDLDFQHQWLAKRENLVVLQLGRWQVSPTHHIEVRDESFLTSLKTQKLLKYLSLRGISGITKLPESIKELVSLEILDLKACHNLETLPDGIASLRKLTHLDVSGCYLLDSMPKGLDKLSSLQVLKGFIIGSSLKSTPIRIKHLQKSLKRLSIHIGSEASIQEEEFDKFKDLKELKYLKISWGKVVTDKDYPVSFPAGLLKLDLEGIPHKTKPEWLRPSKLGNLETLCIKGGKLKDLLVEGEQWINVKYLVLKYTNMQEIKEETRKSVFPSLQYVKKVEWEKKDEKEKEPYEWIEG